MPCLCDLLSLAWSQWWMCWMHGLLWLSGWDKTGLWDLYIWSPHLGCNYIGLLSIFQFSHRPFCIICLCLEHSLPGQHLPILQVPGLTEHPSGAPWSLPDLSTLSCWIVLLTALCGSPFLTPLPFATMVKCLYPTFWGEGDFLPFLILRTLVCPQVPPGASHTVYAELVCTEWMCSR